MNIVLVHYSAPPIVGGVETILTRQAHILSRAGHRVKIIAGRGETWDAQIPVETLALMDSRHPRNLKARANLALGKVPDDFDQLVEQVENELRRSLQGAEGVILHNIASLHKNLALTQAFHNISQSEGAPRFILWHHELAWATPRYQDEMHPGQPWDLLRSDWPGATHVVVTEELGLEYSQISGVPLEKIQVISAGLSLPDFLNLRPFTASLVDNLQLAMAAPLLLTPVRISRRKNLEQAILTVAVLRNTFPDVRLVISGPSRVGTAQEQEYYQSLLKLRTDLNLDGCVHLLAENTPEGLSETSLTDLYRLADALLLTSREEGFGIPILEAGLSGIPIFCTDLPSLHNLAQGMASYFSPNDPPEVVSNIISSRLQNDPVYQMRVRVRHEYTWEAVYRRKIAPLLEGPD